MTNKYNGDCPLCSTQLVLNDDKLHCPSGHYACNRADFESWWDWYLKATYKTPEATSTLLMELKKLDEIGKQNDT